MAQCPFAHGASKCSHCRFAFWDLGRHRKHDVALELLDLPNGFRNLVVISDAELQPCMGGYFEEGLIGRTRTGIAQFQLQPHDTGADVKHEIQTFEAAAHLAIHSS